MVLFETIVRLDSGSTKHHIDVHKGVVVRGGKGREGARRAHTRASSHRLEGLLFNCSQSGARGHKLGRALSLRVIDSVVLEQRRRRDRRLTNRTLGVPTGPIVERRVEGVLNNEANQSTSLETSAEECTTTPRGNRGFLH